MPIVSQFYGIIVRMYYDDMNHSEELQLLWKIMQENNEFFSIEPLK